MTTKPRYNVTVALTEYDFNRLKKLQEGKIKVINVFRAGLEAQENTATQNTIEAGIKTKRKV